MREGGNGETVGVPVKLKCFFVENINSTPSSIIYNQLIKSARIMTSPYIASLYLPYILNSTPKETIVRVLESRNYGTVGLLECIPKINEKNGVAYYRCFVYFISINRDHQIWNDIREKKQTKIYNPDQYHEYWHVWENISELRHSAHIRPQHMDLAVAVHTDMNPETIRTIAEGLDLGFIHSIEELDIPTLCYPYTDLNVWPYANYHVWSNTVKNTYKILIVRYQYWYRTRPAICFQNIIKNHGQVIVPFFDGSMSLTFTPGYCWTPPLTDGVNPYVWVRPIEML
jgi:hypothetical protein